MIISCRDSGLLIVGFINSGLSIVKKIFFLDLVFREIYLSVFSITFTRLGLSGFCMSILY
ncbi:hypothetical protein C2G38_2123470 [Gigaspora rosea]|uniref:Uncharacterized protein n=1 Tax=Gigaspora rosea TaxID=44941 RepID=A0A397TZ55_9GLOM|nr:hypothetical protein C2G38_2123470 [Gigaspora rosea]